MAIKLVGPLIVIIIENVFWDLDGTLIDSEAVHEEAADYALEIMGVAKPALAIPTGLENAAGFELLFGVSVLEEPQLFARFEELVIEYAYLRISREQQITPAVELFRHFAEIGMPQSVVSNSGQFWLNIVCGNWVFWNYVSGFLAVIASIMVNLIRNYIAMLWRYIRLRLLLV